MRKKIFNVVKYLLFLSIGIAMLFLAFKGINLKELWVDLKQANYWWVALALSFGVLSHISRAMRWKLLIEPLGYNPKTSNTFYAVMIGYFANLAAPRLGEITRCGSLHKTDKIPFDSLIGTVIVERSIDLLMLLFITIAIFFAKMDFFGDFMKQHIFIPISQKLSGLFPSSNWIWFLLLSIISLIVILWFYRDKFAHLTIFKKVKKLVLGVITGLKSVFKMKKFPAFIFHTLFIWSMYFLMTWTMVFSLPETSGLGPIDGLFLLVIGSLGMVAPVQGGIGAFHWLVSMGLTLYGIPREKGLVYATISHESQMLMVVILGVISLYFVLMQNKKSYIAE